MFIGVLSLEIRLHAVYSLKEKRKLSNSIRHKIRNKFNVSVAEIDRMDDKTVLNLAISMVCNEQKRIDSTLSKALATVEAMTDQEVAGVNTEIFGA